MTAVYDLTPGERSQSWVREHFTDLLMTYGPPFLLSVLTGGVKLEPEAAKAMKAAGLPVELVGTEDKDGNVTVTSGTLTASIAERLRALEIMAKLGPGYRLDRTTEDEVPRRGVVFLPADGSEWRPEWEELAPHEMPQLASGPPKGKSNGRKRAKGNGKT